MPSRRYFYVDETGQDTRGDLFIVGIAIVDSPLDCPDGQSGQADLDRWRAVCKGFERLSEKGANKWKKAKSPRRLAYMRLVFQNPLFAGRLTFALFTGTQEYDELTSRTIALAVNQFGGEDHNVIRIDALPKEQARDYGLRLCQRGAKVENVRGVRREENDALIRLVDSLCGLVRDTRHDGYAEARALFESAVKQGKIMNLGSQNRSPLG